MLVQEVWKIPFLRLILPLIAGIVVADNLNGNPFIGLSLLLVSSAFVIVYRPVENHHLLYHKRWRFGFFLTLSLFFLGLYITHKSKLRDNSIIQSQLIIGHVNDPAQINTSVVKFPFRVNHYQADKVWYQSNEIILVSIEKDSLAEKLEYGNKLILKGNLKEIRNAGNPAEFDFKKYLERKHLYLKSYQKKNEWKILPGKSGNPVYSFAFKVRNELLNIYRDAGIKGDEFGLLAALTLGSKDFLSDEIIEAYSESGAMHVLSVSGLHVGIIFIILHQILFFLKKNNYHRLIYAFIIISVIWFFAIITGLSPSVNRAAAMITFVIIGKISHRKPSTYNSIAASAFILLLVDPMYLFDVGFQLSYLAVISLVFFYQRLYSILEIRNYLLDKIWSLTCVSVAAQIGTTALSIYYFHQFPVYALLSNLIVVPLSFVVMLLAIVLLCTSFIAPLAKLIGTVLSWTVSVLNGSTEFVEHLPFSTIQNISFHGIETALMHVAILFIMIYIVNKNKSLFFVGILLISIMFLNRDIRYINEMETASFSVYNVPGKSAFSLIQNGKLQLYTDSTLQSNKKAINYLTSNIMSTCFVSDLEIRTIANHDDIKAGMNPINFRRNIFGLNQHNIVIIPAEINRMESTQKFRAEIVVISKNSPSNLDALIDMFEFKILIADSSVPKWKQEIIKKDCQRLAIPFYNVSESGAYTFKTEI